MEGELREYIRFELNRIYREGISQYALTMYNDGWCYNCGVPIHLDGLSRYCSEKCRRQQGDSVKTGYGSNVPNR